MGMQLSAGTTIQCSFGVAPSTLMVLPASGVLTGTPAATIMDNAPMLNVMPFGMCNCPANPMVAAATAAALGVLTPVGCIPATSAPWAPGSPTVMIGNFPALQDSSKLMCMWGGVISVVAPAQVTVQVP
jgi:hypothetical protein